MTNEAASRLNLQIDPWRVYDTKVRDFVRCTVGAKNEEVPIVFATPRKEFAKQDRVDPKNELAKKNPEYAMTVPYPAMSVTRLSPVWDSTRFAPLNQRRLQLSADKKVWLQQRYPAPWDIQYQVDIRSVYRDHMNQIVTQLTLRMDKPYVPLKVPFGPPYGDKNVFVHIDQVTDNSVLETQELDKERILRSSVTLTLKGWLFHRITKTPSAIRIFRDYYLVPSYEEFKETLDVPYDKPISVLPDALSFPPGDVPDAYEYGGSSVTEGLASLELEESKE